MTNKEYRNQCNRTLPDLGERINLCHMTLGLASEVSELISCIGTELKIKVDRINLGEELGDLYWYITNYCNLRELPVPDQVVTELPNDMCLELLLVGIGDLSNLVKRYIAYDKPIEKSKELEITYNIFAALSLFEGAYDLNGDSIRERNINKLKVRYPNKFSNEDALNRNIDNERKVLE